MSFTCRFCAAPLERVVADLGSSPFSNSYLTPQRLQQAEPTYPLCAYFCESCLLVQLPEFESPESIFSDYAYFSSYSDSWLRHAQDFAEMAIERFGLDHHSRVVEVGSNDGYLLQNFVARGVPVLGIEPAANVAEAARRVGVPTENRFFGEAAARDLTARGESADLLIGNNVLAQVPDLSGFVSGLEMLLGPQGVITLEFPHLLRLMQGNQFDTIYHEHFSYFSLIALQPFFASMGLTIFDVDELPSHGGSLRLYLRHAKDPSRPVMERVAHLLASEEKAGLGKLETFGSFADRVGTTRCDLLDFLISARREGKRVVGYGAPGKGNTLLNYCGIRTDLLAFTVDRNPYKHGKFTPGARIPIFPVDRIRETKPDYVLILPWNLGEEIMEQLSYIREWGGRFVVPIPNLEIRP